MAFMSRNPGRGTQLPADPVERQRMLMSRYEGPEPLWRQRLMAIAGQYQHPAAPETAPVAPATPTTASRRAPGMSLNAYRVSGGPSPMLQDAEDDREFFRSRGGY